MIFKKNKTELLNFSSYLFDKGFNMKFVVFKDGEEKANSTNGGKLIEKLLIELSLEKQDLAKNLKNTANGVSRTLKRLKNGEGTIKTLKNYITSMNCSLFITIERINDKKIFSKITSYNEAVKIVEKNYLEKRIHHNGEGIILGEFFYDSNGVPDGHWKEYYSTDEKRLKVEYYFVSGRKEGKHKEFDFNGNLMREVDYVKGYINGKEITYYKNGKVQSIQYYRSNIKNGRNLEYYKEGQLISECNYVNGKKEGDIFFSQHPVYLEYGKGRYKNDRPVGEWKFFNEKDKLTRKTTYDSDGKKYQQILYEDGVIRNITNYPGIDFDENGVLNEVSISLNIPQKTINKISDNAKLLEFDFNNYNELIQIKSYKDPKYIIELKNGKITKESYKKLLNNDFYKISKEELEQ